MPFSMRINKTRVMKLPPLLIHHGKNDKVVEPEQSRSLHGWCLANGAPESVVHDKDDAGHPDMGSSRTDSANNKSQELSLEFLRKWLKEPQPLARCDYVYCLSAGYF